MHELYYNIHTLRMRHVREVEVGAILNREFKIQVHVVTRTAKRTDDVILDIFSKLRTSSYKFTTCKTSSTSKDKT